MCTRSIKIAKAGVACLITVFLYSGCDTVDEPTPIDGPPVSHLTVLPDTTVRVGDQPIRIALRSRFDGLAETPTSFRAIAEGAAFAYSIDDDTLELAALASGIDTVVVQAWGSLLLAVDTLVVTSVCSDAALPGEANYFPHEVGHEWEYNYRYVSTGYYGTVTTEGISTWTLTSSNNSCTQAEVMISEHIVGEGVLESILSTLPDSTWSVSRIVEHRFKLQGDKLDLGELNGPFDRLQPVVWRSAPTDTTNRLSYSEHFGFGTGGRGHVELARDFGIVSYRSYYYSREGTTELTFWID